jgi:hypothetical protein
MQKATAAPNGAPRWVGTGRVVLNNKGLPVKQYIRSSRRLTTCFLGVAFLGMAVCCRRSWPETLILDHTYEFSKPEYSVVVLDASTNIVVWPPTGSGCDRLVACCSAVALARDEGNPPSECLEEGWLLLGGESASCDESLARVESRFELVPHLSEACIALPARP